MKANNNFREEFNMATYELFKDKLFTTIRGFKVGWYFYPNREYPINLVVTQLFDLNARIQQLTRLLIFYWPHMNFLKTNFLQQSGVSKWAGTFTRLRTCIVPAEITEPPQN
jgi:hypothetical protein